jgi:transposase InsO family protein
LIGLLLRSGERDGAEPDADAFDRRAIHKASRVWGAADDTLAEGRRGPRGESQANSGVDAKMGLQAITPGPHTSKPTQGHRIYPYLLRKVKIERVNQVWRTDITYIPMRHGFMYLAAIRLAQSVCAVMGVVEHDGEPVLRGRAGGSAAAWPTGDLQHGSRGAVQIGGVYRRAVGQGDSDQHG